MRAIGVPASEAGNRYYYGGGTPVSNAFSGIRYLISRSGSVLDLQEWQQLASEGACYSYQNQYDLPVGFWTAASLQDYTVVPDGNPFDNQNTLFRLATGVETPLFTRMEVDSVLYEGADATKNGYGSYTYQADAGAETRKLQYNYKLPVDRNAVWVYEPSQWLQYSSSAQRQFCKGRITTAIKVIFSPWEHFRAVRLQAFPFHCRQILSPERPWSMCIS